MGPEGSPRGAVFGREPEVRVEPLLEGPQFDDDPLRTAYRVVEGLEVIYRDPPFFSDTPWLLTPSRAKALYADRFRYFWWGVGRADGDVRSAVWACVAAAQRLDVGRASLR